MKKLVLGLMAAGFLLSTPLFAGETTADVKTEKSVADTKFSVKVTSGTNALGGATVKLFQGGAEIGSAVTNDRGMAELSVPNQEAVTIKVTAKGHSASTKADFIPSETEIVAISMKKMSMKATPKLKK